MQEFQALGGGTDGGGRLFGGGDRRLRPHSHPNHQALKCPRCDSLNTKFCYYNNYNLSQPRHFCKSCRRYWTKGGVLRNVPVGGGCRKTKRSKQKSSAGAVSSADAPRERSSKPQSSSSESSSLTAATTAATRTSTTTAATEEGTAPSNTMSAVFPFSDARFFSGNPSFEHGPTVNQSTSENQIFMPEGCGFASLTASSADMIGFGIADILTTSYGRVEQGNQAPVSGNNSGLRSTVEEFKMQGMAGTGWMNTGGVTAATGSGSGGGEGGESDEGMFDLMEDVVDPAYWSQPHWD